MATVSVSSNGVARLDRSHVSDVAMTRQVRPDTSDGFVLAMARKQYREWIKGNGDYQLMAPVARQSAPQLAKVETSVVTSNGGGINRRPYHCRN
ncbi:hypothetical protein ACIQVE_01915 [Pseudomonas sp. NPDC098747]|uniref:hypothetical protein n=1 Tax=Pseudomonas sp. NPDC098747 TaxID=3364487 RepID=UPI00383A7BA9